MSLEDSLYPLLELYDAAPQPLKSVAGRAYRTLPASWRFGAHYERFRRLAIESERWDVERIRQYQTEAVRTSLRAAAQAPWYAERFRAAGVDPERFGSLEALAPYPLLTKDDLLRYREAMVNPAIPANQRLYLTTGGSSGIPVGFYLQKGISRAKEQAFLEAQFERKGFRIGDRVVVIRGGVTSSRADGRISTYDATRNRLIVSSYHLTIERLPEYVEVIRRFRPQHLHTYPSAALLLARGLEQTGLSLGVPLTSVLCGSEKLALSSQRYLERIFGAPVGHWYGHSERVVLAGQGRTSAHFYFSPTYGYAEFGAPDADGNREVIATSFDNLAMPMIRYRTGDYVRFTEHPDREFAAVEVEEIVGRAQEFVVSGTGRAISLTAINFHDRIFDGLLSVQFKQERPGVLEFRYQVGPQWRPDGVEAIRAGLLVKLGDDFQLTMRQVDETEKTAAGKHRWLITSLKPPFAD